MKELVVYDNSIVPTEAIQDVIGDKKFGDIIVRKKRLSDMFRNSLLGNPITERMDWIEVDSIYAIEELCARMQKQHRMFTQVKIIHCFSNYIITDAESAVLAFGKLPYIHEEVLVQSTDKYAAVMFHDSDSYIDFLLKTIEYRSSIKALKDLRGTVMQADGFAFIGEIFNFIQCITGNFDSRYFNSLKGTEYRIRKSSTNKKKIKSEYEYYHLLPEQMKVWFVMPYDYKENEREASYEMERLHMTDISIKWVHGSIQEDEFQKLMDMYFYFFNSRSKKSITKAEYQKISDELYIHKVKQRIKMRCCVL